MVAEGVSIVLLRGINVGGGNKVRMAELREALEAAGFSGARTYIQTGNIVLDAAPTPALGAAVAEVLRDSFSVDVPVVVVGGPELAAMRDGLPFDGPGDKVAFAFFILGVFRLARPDRLFLVRQALFQKRIRNRIHYRFRRPRRLSRTHLPHGQLVRVACRLFESSFNQLVLAG